DRHMVTAAAFFPEAFDVLAGAASKVDRQGDIAVRAHSRAGATATATGFTGVGAETGPHRFGCNRNFVPGIFVGAQIEDRAVIRRDVKGVSAGGCRSEVTHQAATVI